MGARRERFFTARGMAMTPKEKLLLVWFLAVLAIGFAVHHFLGGAVCVFQNMVALEIVRLHGISKLGALFLGAHF
jgi:hypothetical protein